MKRDMKVMDGMDDIMNGMKTLPELTYVGYDVTVGWHIPHQFSYILKMPV